MLIDEDCIEFAFFHAGATFDAASLVDHMSLFPLSIYGIDRAVPRAKGASYAFVLCDHIFHQ
jgi:hypothetical protein